MSVVDFDGNIINADALDAAVSSAGDVAGLTSDLANTDANVAAVVLDLANTDANVELMIPLSLLANAGDILMNSGTEVVALGVGNVGDVLTLDANSIPSWVAPS